MAFSVIITDYLEQIKCLGTVLSPGDGTVRSRGVFYSLLESLFSWLTVLFPFQNTLKQRRSQSGIYRLVISRAERNDLDTWMPFTSTLLVLYQYFLH